MNVDELYSFILRLIRKNRAGGLSASEFNDFWNAQSRAYHDDLVGRFQARNNGKEGVNTGLIQNETILTKLAPFIKTVSLPVAAGQANKPDDFTYKLTLRINGYAVIFVEYNKWASLTDEVIDPPSISDNAYYYTNYLNYYKFNPSGVASCELDYISTPTNVVWGYSIGGDGRQVYNPGLSFQPQWDNKSCNEICQRVLKQIGVAFKDQDFAGFGQSVQITGE